MELLNELEELKKQRTEIDRRIKEIEQMSIKCGQVKFAPVYTDQYFIGIDICRYDAGDKKYYFRDKYQKVIFAPNHITRSKEKSGSSHRRLNPNGKDLTKKG